jgi:DNA-binding transcriptional MerR regulator
METPRKRPDRTYTIRQLCNEFKVTPRSLRFYEDKGLLAPVRQGLNRIYSNRDRARIQLILRGKRVGFSLSEIRDMLDLYDKDEWHAAQAATSLTKFRKRIAELQSQKIEIDLAIQNLKSTCEVLEAQLAKVSPELLPSAEDYDKVLRARIDGDTHHSVP